MKNNFFSRWMKPGRIIPLLTILFGGVIVLLGFTGRIDTSVAENIIIALLTLVAVDALGERIGILEIIQTKLDNLDHKRETTPLVPDNTIQFEELAKDAREICILAVSGIRLITSYHTFLSEKVKSGCKIRIILTNPDCEAMRLQRKMDTLGGKNSIHAALTRFVTLSGLRSDEMRCEVKLLDLVLPFNVVIIDSNKSVRKMWISFHVYKIATPRRPVVHLDPNKDTLWFNMYKEQFEEAWEDAQPLEKFTKLLADLNN